jgi:alpha-N-acetylglucosamine transferase
MQIVQYHIISGVFHGFVEMIDFRLKPGISLNSLGRFTSKKILSIALVGLFLVLSTIFVFARNHQRISSLFWWSSPGECVNNCSKGHAAVVTFLASEFNGKDNDNDDDDVYYVGARVIAYQLLHAPETKFLKPTPFIVLVTRDVRPSKRRRLMDDGAIVVTVDHVDHNLSIGEPRWVETFTKMRMFDPNNVPYDKVLYVDTDIVFTRPIDGIFRDANTSPTGPLNTTGQIKPDEGELPPNFVMAATPESGEIDHPYPYFDTNNEKSYFNSGLFVYSPSREIFAHYLNILGKSDRYFNGFPDQDLLNYAHRWGGPMPWRKLHFSWNLNWSNDNDLEGGMAALHVKWWDRDYAFKKCRDYSLARRWEMEGYWRGRAKSP